MNGEQLKAIIERSGIRTNEMAKRLGILPQQLNQIFHAADVKSGVLERVAQIMKVSISHLYGEQSTGNGGGVPYDVIKKQNEQIDKLLNIIHEMSKGYGRENNN